MFSHPLKVFLASLLGMLVLLPVAFTQTANTTQTWAGYQAYFIPENGNIFQLRKDLEKGKIPGIQSPWTSKVEISDFTQMDSVAVADVENRLAASDPRWTPYLHEITRFFKLSIQGEKGWVLLAPLGPKEDALRTLLTASLGSTPKRIDVSTGIAGPIQSVLCFVIYCFWILAWYFYRSRSLSYFITPTLVGALGLFLWPSAFFPILGLQVIFFTGEKMIRQYHHEETSGRIAMVRRFFLQNVVITLALITLGFLGSFDLTYWMGLGLGLLALLVLGQIYWKFREHLASVREHKLFSPVNLGLKSTNSRIKEYWPVLVLLLIPLISLELMPVLGTSPLAFLPSTQTFPANFSKQTDQELQRETSGGIPGAASWMSHRIHQEEFLFKVSTQGLEKAPGAIQVPFYTRVGKKVVESAKTMVQLDQPWLESLVRSIESTHPVSLLQTDGYFRRLDSGSTLGNSLGGGNHWTQILTLILLYFFLLLIRFRLKLFHFLSGLRVEARRDSLA